MNLRTVADNAEKERGYRQQGADGGHCVEAPGGNHFNVRQLLDKRDEELENDEQRGERKHREYHHIGDSALDDAAPVFLALVARSEQRVGIQRTLRLGRHPLIQGIINRRGELDPVGRGKGGDDRRSDDDRVDVGGHHVLRHGHGRDDESELTNLRQRETGLNGVFQIGTRHQGSHSANERLDHQRDNHQGKNEFPIFRQYLRVNHHAHRDKEDGREEDFNTLRKTLNTMAFSGFRKNGTYYECTKSGGESHAVGNDHHGEAETEGDNQQVFIVDIFFELPQQCRNQIDTDHKPDNQEEDEFHDAHQHLLAGRGMLTRRDGGNQHHHHHGHNVLDDQYHHREVGKRLPFEVQILESLDDDGGRGHRQHTAEEDAFHDTPAHDDTEQRTHAHHTDDADKRGNEGLTAHRHQFLEAKFQSDPEHHEDDTDFGPGLHFSNVCDGGEHMQVRSHQETGHQIPQYKGLLQKLKNHGHDSR